MASPLPLRFRVVYNNNTRFLYSCNDSSAKVTVLCKELGEVVSSLVGGTVSIKELQTLDNYLVPGNQMISSILRDNDILVAIDLETFMNQEYKLCKSATYTLARSDWNDNNVRKILVGLHEHNKLYIAFSNIGKLAQLELLHKADILSFVRRDKKIITLFENNVPVGDDGKKWCIAKLQVQTVSEEDKEFKLLISLQMSSDPQPEIHEISIDLTGSMLKIGEKVVVQRAIEDLLSKGLPVVVPEGSLRGEMLPDVISPVTKTKGDEPAESDIENLKITQLPVDGELKVKVAQNYGSGNKIHLFYDCEFLFVNSSDKPCNVTSISSSYLSENGKDWIAFDKTVIGRNNAFIDIPANSSTSLSLGSQLINREGPVTSDRNRTPPGLPQPMRIRYVLALGNGLKHELEVEQINSEMKLKTMEEGDLFWMSCDDASTLTRHIFKIQKEVSNSNAYFRIYFKSNSSQYFYLSDLQKLAWQAKNAQDPCFLIKDFSHEQDSYSCDQKVYALVNLEKSYVYGLRVVMETQSCRNEKCFAFPALF